MSNIFGQHDLNTIEQFKKVESYAVKSALMADGHYGYVMPVGGVAGFRNQVSVIGVGFDIACGNCAIQTNLKLFDLIGYGVQEATDYPNLTYESPVLRGIADAIERTISFGIGRRNRDDNAPIDAGLFDDLRWNLIPKHVREPLREKARTQLGTVGSGNHYVDVFVDRWNGLWVGVHFGSRGLGHTIASSFLALGQGGDWGDRGKEQETLLDLSTQLGQDYWQLMQLAGEYAYLGREWVATKVTEDILGGKEIGMVHNHHNFAWKEDHLVNGNTEELVVVRKGATPAFPGQYGFVGGSMGDNAVILQGSYLGTNAQCDSLFSTVHGAGRVMSRTEAAGKKDRKTGKLKLNKETGLPVKEGRIKPEEMTKWLRNKGVILRGGGLDESPQVYRRLDDVLEAQGNTIEIVEVLKPLIVVMAGEHEFDPYKD